MSSLRLVLGDQLSPDISSLSGADKDSDIILIAEVSDEATYVRHHKKKIAFLFAAMRHFANELTEAGYNVCYTQIGDKENVGSLRGEVMRALEAGEFDSVVITKPGEWRLLSDMETWADIMPANVELRDDERFIATIGEFSDWADGRKQLRMEYFYRDMRRKTGLLIEDSKPTGGEWNYDKQNRKKLLKSVSPPHRRLPEPDDLTRGVIDEVAEHFGNHFGDLEPFYYATTRKGAEAIRDHFIEDVLPGFGDYQDAMAKGEPWMWHSLVSMYINCGLLDPLDICKRAETEYTEGRAPLNAVEGFIRQIIGWREYVRGLYWLKMPEYKDMNALGANRKMPDLYWTAETEMACMADAIGQTKRHAYAHHIQRLMITGNFALLAGIHPDEVNDWYLCVYADAYEWVELPNTHGMAIYADGGIMASKPYAASANYINKMSDYCSGCTYDHKAKTGEDACPFNSLYWDFLARNKDALSGNPRMGLVMKNLDKKDQTELKNMRAHAASFLESIGASERN